MTLDDAIKRAQDVVEACKVELGVKYHIDKGGVSKTYECMKDHILLVEWLKELKNFRDHEKVGRLYRVFDPGQNKVRLYCSTCNKCFSMDVEDDYEGIKFCPFCGLRKGWLFK